MQPDDLICYCYHVPLRKLLSFAQRERPARPSQMSQCLGAGTGCGWCIPFLKRIAACSEAFSIGELTPEEYASRRKTYIVEQRPKNTFEAEA